MANNVVKQENFLPAKSQELETDYTYVRENLYQLIETGNYSIEQIRSIAEQSQHPRAYEVLATLLKQTAEMNLNLIAISKNKNEDVVPKDELAEKKNESTINNLFVGTPGELREVIEQMRKKNNDPEE